MAESQDMQIRSVVQTKQNLMAEFTAPEPVAEQENAAFASQADAIVANILAVDPKDLAARDAQAGAVRQMGARVQADIARQSQMLKTPMTTLMHDAEDGGQVARDLLTLQEQVNDINPNRVDFTMSSVRRLLAKLPGIGTPLASWFAKYQQVDSVINDIMASLKDGRAQLERDNTTLTDDQRRMRELTFSLQDYVNLGQMLDRRLAAAIESLAAEDAKRQFLEEELLFPLRQRIVDLQQQLAVNQQGVLATEVIIRNNRQLVIGVDRAVNVTVTALNTAATLQIALQHQKKVLAGVQAVTDTTNQLIAGTAEQLKTQGTAIQKQATQTQLDIDVLKKAFQDVEDALDDLRTFRREALPTMAQSISDMDDLSGRMAASIERMESGNAAAEDYLIVIDKEIGGTS